MKICGDCKFCEIIDIEKGIGKCFGHSISINRSAKECPTNSFKEK